VRAREEKIAGGFGEGRYAGEERERGREGADRPGPAVSERKRREGERGSGWEEVGRGAAHAGERKEGRELGLGETWARGREERKGARGKRGSLGCWALFPFSFLHSNIQTKLFEFK
jgi:hypothetical protein